MHIIEKRQIRMIEGYYNYQIRYKMQEESCDYQGYRRRLIETQRSDPRTLLTFLRRALIKTPDHHKLKYVKYENQVTMYVLERKPLYVSDGDICIQASFGPPQKLPLLNPLNKLTTPFYAAHQKPHIVFNCHDSTITPQPIKYPSPYHPCYHFKDYQGFKQGRNKAKILLNCDKIVIKDWLLILVNISNSGYYAPFIVINNYTKEKSTEKVTKPVENILFCGVLTSILEKCRIRDMQAGINCKIELPVQDYSMVYYMRARKPPKIQNKPTLINLDKNGEILQYNKNRQMTCLPIGNLPKISIFKRPIENKYVKFGKLKINYEQAYIVKDKNQYAQQADEDSLEMYLWSDQENQPIDNEVEEVNNRSIKKEPAYKPYLHHMIDEECEVNREEICRLIEQENENEKYIEIESDESEPDLLKNVYKDSIMGDKIV